MSMPENHSPNYEPSLDTTEADIYDSFSDRNPIPANLVDSVPGLAKLLDNLPWIERTHDGDFLSTIQAVTDQNDQEAQAWRSYEDKTRPRHPGRATLKAVAIDKKIKQAGIPESPKNLAPGRFRKDSF